MRGEFGRAAGFAHQILAREPDLTQALHLAGRCSLETGDHEQALEYFNRIPDEKSLGASQARCFSGHVQVNSLRRLNEAETQLRRALWLDPTSKLATDQLA